MAISLREVADRAGLSRATVSRILNDRGEETRISKHTQERVRIIASELGYRPNRLAQSLSKGRSNIVGLMIPGLHNPFFLDLLETAEIAALQAGYDVLPDSAFQMREIYHTRSKLSGWPVDGVLAWLPADKSVVDYPDGLSTDVPTVYMGYERTDGSDYVAVDRESGIRELMIHLYSSGYKRIAYLFPWMNLQPVDVRFGVYETLCAEFHREPERIFLEQLDSQGQLPLVTQAGLREAGLKTGIALALRSKADRPDAVICHNDLVAIGLYHGLMRGGLHIPQDIAVIGFDGIDEGQLLNKPLTTVVSPGADMIKAALQILTDRLDLPKEEQHTPKQVVLPSKLRIGATT
jgi:DNA-binding LacI/PurR family transcriptional regulator